MSDRTPVPGEAEIDRIEALIEAYEPGNYALADGVCHVYYEVPGSTTTLYADLVKLRRAAKTSEGLVIAAREVVQAKDADSPYIEQHMSIRLRSAITRMAECLKRSGEAWRSIETAPLDGSDVMIGAWYDSGVWSTEIARYAHYANGMRWSIPVGQTGKPTHWRPMPDPPVRE